MAVREKPLVERQTAQIVLSEGQQLLAIMLPTLTICSLILWTRTTLTVLLSLTFAFYFVFVFVMKAGLHVESLRYEPPALQPVAADDPDLPVYALLVPVHKEAEVLASLLQALHNLRYPKDKLQVLLLTEEDDVATRSEIAILNLPEWITEVVIPDVQPRGKPKAMNVGLGWLHEHRPETAYVAIYDAEDTPDPGQLLLAVAGFRAAPDNVGCLQARLRFWNVDTSWISRFYAMEYVVHFERVLPGLAKLGLIPPLGGTSNHFRIRALHDSALKAELLPEGARGIGAWDPFNVTEDAELAGALMMLGYRVMILPSETLEGATVSAWAAVKQRSRWLKGYLQTALVYMRQPIRTARQMGPIRWAAYVLLMFGTPVSNLLNPIFWTLTVVYFTMKYSQADTSFIESLFPAPLYYSGLLLMIAGNALMFYQMMGACLHHGDYGSVKYMLLTPAWWMLTAVAAYRATWQLVFRPHYWDKTDHSHLALEGTPAQTVTDHTRTFSPDRQASRKG